MPGTDGTMARRLRVLVVDDDADTTASLTTLLRLQGHAAESTPNGLAALRRARAWHPDVVLLDIAMPGMDGWELARRLRRLGAGPPLLLVALSGYGAEGDRAQSARAGIDLHLLKPVEPKELADLLERFKGLVPA